MPNRAPQRQRDRLTSDPPGRSRFSVIHSAVSRWLGGRSVGKGPCCLISQGSRRIGLRALLQTYFLSRSSSSIEMSCGPRMKQMRTPGRMVVGSLVNSTPLALISAATASISFTLSPK
jgi:hypothetical protein